ncbi:hypothetical protein [Jeotgalibacillus salarius]|uniref:Uncharacterized protein n=1 Tax=Jeotgalibacillus salarius TaxID=546023 RepID=A0A4Y8LLU1_9BACL|nr:hypothetical protein [Jeotgalibacillus salarius]TFE02217.1 hypothetical protein E2626_06460 [Jeotgalibacillus salarius]
MSSKVYLASLMTKDPSFMLHYQYVKKRGSEYMKAVNLMIVIITLMHFSFLINQTAFDGEFSGLVMTINTILFLVAMITFATVRNAARKSKVTS